MLSTGSSVFSNAVVLETLLTTFGNSLQSQILNRVKIGGHVQFSHKAKHAKKGTLEKIEAAYLHSQRCPKCKN